MVDGISDADVKIVGNLSDESLYEIFEIPVKKEDSSKVQKVIDYFLENSEYYEVYKDKLIRLRIYKGYFQLLFCNNKGRKTNNSMAKHTYSYETFDQLEKALKSAYNTADYEYSKKERIKAEKNKLFEQKFQNNFKVGDILNGSWGYEQTNQEWYVVTKVLPKSVKVRELPIKKEENGFMSYKETPVNVDGEYAHCGKEKTVRLVNYGKDVRINPFCNLSKWDGKPKTSSHYA